MNNSIYLAGGWLPSQFQQPTSYCLRKIIFGMHHKNRKWKMLSFNGRNGGQKGRNVRKQKKGRYSI